MNLLAMSLDYLDFIRSKDCLIHGTGCSGLFPNITAAHLENVGTGNSRKKMSYRHLSAVPLCWDAHMEQEKSTSEFNKKYRIDLYREALSLVIEFLTSVNVPFHNDKIRG